jgi:hypothetical protein
MPAHGVKSSTAFAHIAQECLVDAARDVAMQHLPDKSDTTALSVSRELQIGPLGPLGPITVISAVSCSFESADPLSETGMLASCRSAFMESVGVLGSIICAMVSKGLSWCLAARHSSPRSHTSQHMRCDTQTRGCRSEAALPFHCSMYNVILAALIAFSDRTRPTKAKSEPTRHAGFMNGTGKEWTRTSNRKGSIRGGD